jgi:hypothetical protein
VRFRIPIGTTIGAPTKRVDLGRTAKIYAGKTSIWAAGVRGGGGAARRRGERARGAGRKRGGWWASRGFRTWAERPNAGPHVGENKRKNMSPVFQGGKKKNRRFRLFFLTLLRVNPRGYPRRLWAPPRRHCPAPLGVRSPILPYWLYLYTGATGTTHDLPATGETRPQCPRP